MICTGCKRNEDLRFGYCFDCASQGEKRAAKRTTLEHVAKGIRNILEGSKNYQFDFRWAMQRVTRTGDYAPNGYFEKEYGAKEIWKCL
jgi:hypothetical protein